MAIAASVIRPIAPLIAVALGLLGSGCAIVNSVPGTHGAEGIAYMLPRALLPVELVHDGSAFELRIQSAVMVGDPGHIYAMQRSGNVFTSDNVVVSVDAVTGLLSAVTLASDDKSADAISKLASGLKAESGDAVNTVVVFRDLFDPGWAGEAVSAFNARLHAAARTHLQRLGAEQACMPASVDAACKALRSLAAEVAAGAFAVSVDGAGGEPPKPADCSAGFCYRINVPHVVRLQAAGISNSAVFGLPNRSPTFVMPLERWAFVKTTHDVKLKGGVFESVTTDRPSSALAVAAVPFDIAKGAVKAAAELVTLKLDLSGKEKSLADAKVAEIQAKSVLDKALLDKAPAKQEFGVAGAAGSRAAPQLSIRLGPPSQQDATKNLVGVAHKPVPAGGAGNNPPEAKAPAAGGQTSAGGKGTLDAEKK